MSKTETPHLKFLAKVINFPDVTPIQVASCGSHLFQAKNRKRAKPKINTTQQ